MLLTPNKDKIRWLLVGHGNLGKAMVSSWQKRDLCSSDCWIVDRHHSPLASFTGSYAEKLQDLPAGLTFDLAILAIKPQQMHEAFLSAEAKISVSAWLSVMAGLRSATVRRLLGRNDPVIRAMPNICSRVARSVTGIWSPRDVPHQAQQTATNLLSAIGECLWLEEEAQLDAFTAIYGSGPAYILAFVEALIASADQHLGGAVNEAMVLEMISGTLDLIDIGDKSVADLRKSVTSRGGTTEIALAILQAQDPKPSLQSLLQGATQQAKERSEMLARKAK